MTIEIASLAISILAVVITIWIALRQGVTLTKVKAITQRIEDAGDTRKNVASFVGKSTGQPIDCIFPVQFESRPLPRLAVGDYRALSVLSTLITTDPLVLKPSHEDQPPGEKPKARRKIFLCSPGSNPELREIMPCIEKPKGSLTGNELVEYYQTALKNSKGLNNIPCWFAHVESKRKGEEDAVALVVQGDMLTNPGIEGQYIEASRLAAKVVYKPFYEDEHPVGDSALIARLTRGSETYFVIAGVHQAGTWIAADFISRLLTGKIDSSKDIFFGKEDFMAVVWGSFNSKKLAVEWSGIQNNYVFQKVADSWVIAK